ncbi:MAG: flavin prenyltransferase UbiX [Mariprofundales bacterium]|nr:flavin prenyltransferase UbiX [Mariprofundales bacterium]
MPPVVSSPPPIKQRPISIAITGASGSCYALRLIEQLARQQAAIHLMISDAARTVLLQECGLTLPTQPQAAATTIANHLNSDPALIHLHPLDDWFAPPASGSADIRQMVVVPCSMGTLARISCGISQTLIERAADVIIKEQRQLLLVPRETPLSAIHLEQMLKLTTLGVQLLPAMPGFYNQPQSIADLVDFIVERIMDNLNREVTEVKRWGT